MNPRQNKDLKYGSTSGYHPEIINTRAIGGYFGLELANHKNLYHDHLTRVNYGRSALEYILRAKGYKKLYIPYYICDVILQPLIKLNVEYEFYHINTNLEPKVDHLEDHSALLQVNYFGLMNNRLPALKEKYSELIVDNSMAFFSKPIQSIHCFYSPRKFFGVPDGGFAFIDSENPETIRTKDISFHRTSHLLKRLDVGPEKGYDDFKNNELASNNPPLVEMSRLTEKILRSIDYQAVIEKRNDNFACLHSHLQPYNEFTPIIEQSFIHGPMAYPFLKKGNSGLRRYLIENRIYVAQYWPNIPKWIKNPYLPELYLFENLIPLPIDQRYDSEDMKRILEVIQNF